jgi:hypothetical protein
MATDEGLAIVVLQRRSARVEQDVIENQEIVPAA